ncbi:CU044_2847 family protein [Streptomyces sp. DH24]|uniref:CU044_2847 family protein n=1 Tax=Streptomyces sp. DH24 TaxID=3040123 RepID=UPI002441CF8B|nr:CU044_2847 family protein [Streptomyces sp. DH24]MDG9716402.1 CU044_2847 family protein [Streptomyces sp. DH24]
MESVDRLSLEDGGEIVFEVVPGAALLAGDGPVKAGRMADAARRVPQTLRGALEPVREMTRTVVTQLREAGPAEVEVEFGLSLSGQVGVIVNKGEATAHLRIRALWRSEASASDDV